MAAAGQRVQQMITISKTRTVLYFAAKLLGDISAVLRGRIGKRIGRRVAGKVTGRALGRWFR